MKFAGFHHFLISPKCFQKLPICIINTWDCVREEVVPYAVKNIVRKREQSVESAGVAFCEGSQCKVVIL